MVNSTSQFVLPTVVLCLLFTSFTGCVRQPNVQATEANRREMLRGITVSPDGKKAAFVCQEVRGTVPLHSTVIVVDLNTKKIVQEKRLEGLRAEAWYGMSWSPDGKWLALSAYEKESTPWGIWRFTIADGKTKSLSVLENGLLQRPLISPNGSSILFRDAHRGDLAIHKLGAKDPRFITSGGDVHRLGFDYRPNGSYIYYGRAKPGGIWRMRPNGKEQKLLRGSEKIQAVSLRISFTGKHIAFVDANAILFVSSLSDFAPKRVSKSVGYDIRWSPTAEELVYARFDEKSFADKSLRIWSAKGSKKLPKGVIGRRPVWAKRGQSILFLTSAEDEIWSYEFRTKRRQRVFPK